LAGIHNYTAGLDDISIVPLFLNLASTYK